MGGPAGGRDPHAAGRDSGRPGRLADRPRGSGGSDPQGRATEGGDRVTIAMVDGEATNLEEGANHRTRGR